MDTWKDTGTREGVAGRAVARGFTLLEVMIVILIILAIGGLVAFNLFGQRDVAQTRLVQVQLNSFKSALKFFNLDYNRYPTDEEGLAVLWNKDLLDPDADQTVWHAYTEEPLPRDPWGHEWGYRAESEDGRLFDLWSNGPDGEEGTEDDISAWRITDDEDGGGDFGPNFGPSGSGGG